MTELIISALRKKLKEQLLNLESIELAIKLVGENNELKIEQIKAEIEIERTCQLIHEYKSEV